MPTAAVPPPWIRRLAAELALWTAVGVVMAFLGPFGSAERTLGERIVYWLACMVGGGLIGAAIDWTVRRRVRAFWPRLLAVSVLMTPAVTRLVGVVNHLLADVPLTPGNVAEPWFQVFIVCFGAMALRQLTFMRPTPPTAPAPAVPDDPTAAFRRRLSARRRAAAIHAVEAEDHYLRVHTDAGDELITARFSDALEELSQAPGFRTHRSWWVAAEAIEDVRWGRGRGEARLKCGLTVPVSRSQAPQLKAAGWF